MEFDEARHVRLARLGQPALHRFARLAGLFGTRVFGHPGGFFQPIKRLRNEFSLQLPEHRLRVGVADVHVAMVNDENVGDDSG